MNPTTAALISAIHADGMQPVIINEVSENLMYVGYCLPTCTGTDDAKWLIKRIQTESMEDIGTIQTIYLANGSHLYNQKWDDRATLTYKMTENETTE